MQRSGPLDGDVVVHGAKNSVLKLMAATILAEGRHVLTNVPKIRDVAIMAEMLEALGIQVTTSGPHELTIDTPATSSLSVVAPYELVEKMRASIVVLGPLLARCGRATVSMPGGDDFGSRPIDYHLHGVEEMGAAFTSAHGFINGEVAGGRLHGAVLGLEFPSHTTTDNLLMAAVLADGVTVIENAAREPEVVDLANFLISMGAKIEGAGTSRITVTGVDVLTPVTHAVVGDRVVAATYLTAVAMTEGAITVHGVTASDLEMLLAKLHQVGVQIDANGSTVTATMEQRLVATDFATLPYPGVATDYTPCLVAALSIASGVSFVTENLFAGRFRYVDELRRMGADIRSDGHHLVIRGCDLLSGARVKSHDIRAGAAVLLAGLVADGETVIDDDGHVDRGYEDLPGTLASLGGKVERW